MREIYERSAKAFTVTFPSTPVSARWKLWNKTAQTEVVAWTTIAAPESSETITTTGTHNQIRSGKPREVMELMVQSDYGDDEAIETQVIRYAIKNLVGIDDDSGS